MLRNTLKSIRRSLERNRTFHAINVSGLAIGLASSLIIIVYIINESSYDNFHLRGKDIYRLYLDGKMAEESFKGAWTSPIFGPTFQKEIPEIENFCRFDFDSNKLMWNDPSAKHLEDRVMYADSSFFEVFSLRLLEGDPASCLDEPGALLISESKLYQYFPDGEAMGQTIAMDEDSILYKVTGVVEDAPKNSHFVYDFICSYSSLESSRITSWFDNHMQTYMLVRRGSAQEKLDEKINASLLENIGPLIERFMGISMEEFAQAGNKYGVFTQPLLDIHLDNEIDIPDDMGYRPLGNKNHLRIFALIALFIVLIASINFMNLSTARSVERAKEVALRKVAGANRRQLIPQFLLESVVFSLISLLIAIMLVLLLLKPFNQVTGLQLSLPDLSRWYLLPLMLLLTVLVGLLSGCYPSLVLAAFKPIHVLKSNNIRGRGSALLRHILVCVQFTISIIIIAGTLVIFWQFRYLTQKDPGFDRENLLVIERIHPLGGNSQIQTFKRALCNHSAILSASNSTSYLGSSNNNQGFRVKGRSREERILFHTYWADTDFQETYGFELATPESRFFSKDLASDSAACLVNEAAIRKYNLKNPLEQTLIWNNDENTVLNIIGVMRDHHFMNLKAEIGAQIVILKPESWNWPGYLTLRLASGKKQLEAGLSHLRQTWEEFAGDELLQYFFLDEQMNNYYGEEKRTSKVSLIFSILAILIAAMGLFGLTLHQTQIRIREIGIRKALGSSEFKIVSSISKKAQLTISISILIALPLAYLFTQGWLRNFPYQIGFKPLLFALSALLALLVSQLTMAITAFKAAHINPAEALHYE